MYEKLEKIIDICLLSSKNSNQTKTKERAINTIIKLFTKNLCDECGCNIGVKKVGKQKLCFYCRNDMNEGVF